MTTESYFTYLICGLTFLISASSFWIILSLKLKIDQMGEMGEMLKNQINKDSWSVKSLKVDSAEVKNIYVDVTEAITIKCNTFSTKKIASEIVDVKQCNITCASAEKIESNDIFANKSSFNSVEIVSLLDVKNISTEKLECKDEFMVNNNSIKLTGEVDAINNFDQSNKSNQITARSPSKNSLLRASRSRMSTEPDNSYAEVPIKTGTFGKKRKSRRGSIHLIDLIKKA